MFFYMPLFL